MLYVRACLYYLPLATECETVIVVAARDGMGAGRSAGRSRAIKCKRRRRTSPTSTLSVLCSLPSLSRTFLQRSFIHLSRFLCSVICTTRELAPSSLSLCVRELQKIREKGEFSNSRESPPSLSLFLECVAWGECNPDELCRTVWGKTKKRGSQSSSGASPMLLH